MSLDSLRLVDLSDREVLLVVRDVVDGDGWAYAYDVGAQLGVVEEHRRRAAAQRLSWLRRFGAVEREHLADENGNLLYTAGDTHRPRWGQRWRLTDAGEAIALGRLRAPEQRAIDGLDEPAALLAVREIARRARYADVTLAKLIDREWRHQWTRENGRPA